MVAVMVGVVEGIGVMVTAVALGVVPAICDGAGVCGRGLQAVANAPMKGMKIQAKTRNVRNLTASSTTGYPTARMNAIHLP